LLFDFEILSVQDNPERSVAGKGRGRWGNCGENGREAAGVLPPPDCSELRRSRGTFGGAWRSVDSRVVPNAGIRR